MATATLQIVGDASSVSRMLAVIRADSKRTSNQIASDARGAARDIARSYDQIRAAALRGAAQRAQSARTTANVERAAEEGVARTAAAGARARTDVEKRSATERAALIRAAAQMFVQSERQKTAAFQRETSARERVARDARGRFVRGGGNDGDGFSLTGAVTGVGRGIGRAARFAGRTAVGATSSVLGDIGTAQRTAAGRERLVNGALFQAGMTGTRGTAARAQIAQFLASDEGRGIDGDTLAAALNRTQTETSVLNREGGLGEFLRNATLARNTYQDVGEVTRVGGLLSNMGVRGTDNRSALLALTGIAQQGAIELSDVSSEALGPLVQNINNAVSARTRGGQSLTDEERSRVVSGAAARSLAIAEITQGTGIGPRRALNAFSQFETGLLDENRVHNLRTSIRRRTSDRDFGALDGELFEEYRDARGATRHRMRNTNGLEAGQRLLQVFGNDPVALSNALAGGGHGNPQTFANPVREMLRALSITGEGGQTGFQRAGQLSQQTITEERVREGEQMTLAETQTRLTQQNEEHIRALMGNTAALDLANRVAALRAADPILAATLQAGGGDAAVMAAAMGGAGGPRQLGFTEMASARRAALEEASGGTMGALWNGVTQFSGGGAQLAADADPDFRRRYEAALQRQVTARGGGGGAAGAPASFGREAVADLVHAIERIRLTVAPDAIQSAQGRAEAATGAGAPPPEARNR